MVALEDFWIPADGVDYSPALLRAQIAMAGFVNGIDQPFDINLGPRTYQFLNTANGGDYTDIIRSLRIVGPSKHVGLFQATMSFPNGRGLRCNFPGSYAPDPTAGSDLILEGVRLLGPGGSGDHEAHGIKNYSNLYLKDVRIENFQGDGVHVYGQTSINNALGAQSPGHTVYWWGAALNNTVYSITVNGQVFSTTSPASGVVDPSAIATTLTTAVNAVYSNAAVNQLPNTLAPSAVATLSIYWAANNTTYSVNVSTNGGATWTLVNYTSPVVGTHGSGEISAQFIAIALAAAINAAVPQQNTITINTDTNTDVYTATVNGTACSFTSVGGGVNATATGLAAAIQAQNATTHVNAAAVGNVVTLTAQTPGTGFTSVLGGTGAGLMTQIAGIASAGAASSPFENLTFGASVRVSPASANLRMQMMTVAGNNGGLPTRFYMTASTNLRVAYSSNMNIRRWERVQVFGCGRYGVYISGSDANTTCMDNIVCENNVKGQIIDLAFLGATWLQPYVKNVNGAEDSVNFANIRSCGSVYLGSYVEGGPGVQCWHNGGVHISNKVAAFAAANGLVLNPGNGIMTANSAIQVGANNGGGAFNAYGQLGDVADATKAAGYYASGLADGISIHHNLPAFGTGYWTFGHDTLSLNRVFMAIADVANTLMSPGEPILVAGHSFGGQTEFGQTTPQLKMQSITIGGINCILFHDLIFGITGISNTTPPAITAQPGVTQIAGKRAILRGIRGNCAPLNGQWIIATPASGAFNISGGTAQGVYSAGGGSFAIGRAVGWSSAPPASGTWAVGDLIINNAPSQGGPMFWLCTATGTPGTWEANNSVIPILPVFSHADYAAGGSIGTAGTTVDIAGVAYITQTTAAQSLTIPSPTVTTAGRSFLVVNTGTTSVTAASAAGGGPSVAIASGRGMLFSWDGATWRPAN